MPNADHSVDVYFEAVPFSDNYYQLSPGEKIQVNALLLEQLNQLIPLQQQQSWRNIFVPNSDYDGILLQVNSQLMQELVPPQGTNLVLADPAAVYWLPTQLGHRIISFARLEDQSNGSVAAWVFSVPFNGNTYDSRMGLAYACVKV